MKILILCLFSLSAYAVDLVTWDSEEGQNRFVSSKYRSDFFKLSNNFVAQDNKIVCGLASSTIVLNALRLRKSESLPEDNFSIRGEENKYIAGKFNPFFKRYTQNNVLTSKTKSRSEVFGKPIKVKGELKSDFGLQLQQLVDILTAHGLKVNKRVVNEKTNSAKALEEIKTNLKTKDDYVLVNYSRKSLGQKGGGHISPVAAYDQKSDSFLIMDVNPNKAPWVWVSSKDLIAAMNTFDTLENRGYLLIKDK